MSTKSNKKIIIIGGVAAGTKTAAKTRREDPNVQIDLFTDEQYISYAGCGEPYYIGGEIQDRSKLLARTPEQFEKLFNVRIHARHKVTKINPEEKTIEVENLNDGYTRTETFDVLVISTGAAAIMPPIPGSELPGVCALRTIPDTDRIHSLVGSGNINHAVVVGGGFIGLEMVEQLANRGIKVTLVEKLPQLAPPYDPDLAALIKNEVEKHGVRVMLNSALEEIIGDDKSGVKKVKVNGEEFPAEMVLLSVGVRPNVEIARNAGITIGTTGAIKVNERLQTNYPYIYAAGDCTETTHMVSGKPVWIPLGSTANRQGRVLAINITGGNATFPGVMGTGIFRVFDMNVSRTGLIEKEAKAEGFDYEAVVVPTSDLPHYMPNGQKVIIKLIAERGSGRVLGAQAWGPGKVDKVIDTFVTALTFKATVDDLTQLDLAYAPPFAPPLGNATVAANVMQNKLRGKTESVLPSEIQERISDDHFVFLDVRNPDELNTICLEKTVNIPYPELESRSDELPRDKEIITSCGIGLRALNSYHILKSKGFDNVKYMDGGITVWPEPKPGPANEAD